MSFGIRIKKITIIFRRMGIEEMGENEARLEGAFFDGSNLCMCLQISSFLKDKYKNQQTENSRKGLHVR